jgi:septal ring factor EnvC (AmiA/AmiB activator)
MTSADSISLSLKRRMVPLSTPVVHQLNCDSKLERMLSIAEERVNRSTTVRTEKDSLLEHIKGLKGNILQLSDDITDIKARMLQRQGDAKALENAKAAADQRLPNESERDFLIREYRQHRSLSTCILIVFRYRSDHAFR